MEERREESYVLTVSSQDLLGETSKALHRNLLLHIDTVQVIQ